MRLRTLAVAALAAMTLAACSKDGKEGPDGPEIPEGKTYATFAISVTGSNNTRAFLGDLAPTASEGTVDQLTVYIYDVQTRSIEEVLSFSDKDDSHTIEIAVGPKRFFATSGMAPVFNQGDYNPDIDNIIVNIADETAFKGTLTVANKFYMTSDVVNHTVVSATEAEAETPGNNNYIVMKLGRAVAKIGVFAEMSQDVMNRAQTPVKVGAMSSMEYKVKNQPNRMYLFTGADVSGVWRTPYFDRHNNTWESGDVTDYWSQGAYSATTLTGGNHTAPTYMMENSNMTARYGNATYVSIKGIFTPSTWYDAGDNIDPSPATAGADFWRIATDVEFESDGTTVKTVKTWRADNKVYSAEPNASVLSGDYAVKYEGGKMYYWIYLDNSLAGTNGMSEADKYTQRRNQYWDVQVNSITGLGWNTEDGGKPENPKPLDDDTYIHATIQVLNWVGVSMPGDLEGSN